MTPAGNKSVRLSQASHVKYNTYLPTYLFSQLADVPGLDITSMDSKDLCELQLYGSRGGAEGNAGENARYLHFPYHIHKEGFSSQSCVEMLCRAEFHPQFR